MKKKSETQILNVRQKKGTPHYQRKKENRILKIEMKNKVS